MQHEVKDGEPLAMKVDLATNCEWARKYLWIVNQSFLGALLK
jgi:hypothetical protein